MTPSERSRCGARACGEVVRTRWSALSLQEASGSLGDLGTFLPLLVAMAAFGVVSFAPALFWAGVYNVLAGLLWDSPMPVQPMKTISAVVTQTGNLSNPGLTTDEVIGAGLSVSVITLALGLTGLIEVVHYLIPGSVVRGLQAGLGTSMVGGGMSLMDKLPFWPAPADCGLLAVLSALTVLVADRFARDRFPSALLLTVLGFVLAGVKAGPPFVAPAAPLILAGAGLGWADVWQGFLKAGLAQLPLTTLNSVIAVVALNNERLFPDKPSQHVSRRAVSASVGMMNVVGLWFGALPLCHGAGGLAGQFRFGARHGTSIILLGLVKVLLACVIGNAGPHLLGAFPKSILGVMLVFAGISLTMAGLARASAPGAGKPAAAAAAAPSAPALLLLPQFSVRAAGPGEPPGGDGAAPGPSAEDELTVLATTATVTVAVGTGFGFLAGMVAALFAHQLDHVLRDARALWAASSCCKRADRAAPQSAQSPDDDHGSPSEPGYTAASVSRT